MVGFVVGGLATEGGNEDHRRVPARTAERREYVEAVESWHADVGNDGGDGRTSMRLPGDCFQAGDQIVAVAGLDDLVSVGGDDARNHFAHIAIVLRHHHTPRTGGAGGGLGRFGTHRTPLGTRRGLVVMAIVLRRETEQKACQPRQPSARSAFAA